jgi:NCAIR mutase (PurE)-related protein
MVHFAARRTVRVMSETPFGHKTDELDFATLDLERGERTGFGEVIYCPGKTDAQIASIAVRLVRRSGIMLATRASASNYEAVRDELPDARFDADARVIIVDRSPLPRVGMVAVVSAGTADKPVAAEAAACLDVMGNAFARIDDVGVAGLHRVLDHVGALRSANAVIVIAGMDGALPSVVAGLTDRPVIAVPTSVGYGASFGGLAALLAMLNSCAAGIAVVNIDNGYGAACMASRINRLQARA